MSNFRKKLVYFVYFRIVSSHLPSMIRLRRQLLKVLLEQPLEALVVRAGVYISGYDNLILGKHVSINHNCFLSCEGGLNIGDYVAIGHGTSVLTTEHGFTDVSMPMKYQPMTFKAVNIGNDVWIGANVTILAGVKIAHGTVVAAGAVVIKDIIETNTIVGGVPAKFIKKRL